MTELIFDLEGINWENHTVKMEFDDIFSTIVSLLSLFFLKLFKYDKSWYLNFKTLSKYESLRKINSESND